MLYTIRHPTPLQLGMSRDEQLWLDSFSSKDLKRCLRQINPINLRRGVLKTSQYRGIHRLPQGGPRPWRAVLQKTVNKRRTTIWSQNFETEEAAAHAWDHAAVQHYGRHTATNFTELPGPPADICWDVSPASSAPKAPGNRACSTAPMETLVHGYQGIWQITSGNFNGYLRVNGETVLVGTYVTADEAAKARDRLIYKMDSPCALQIGLSDADKQWLDAHSLDDLRLEFRRASFKPRRRSCTSNFRGVCLVGKMYIAQLTSTVGGQFKFLFRKKYATEREAAHAWDRAALQHRGRYTLTNFTYSEEDLADILLGSQEHPSTGTEDTLRSGRANTGKRRARKAAEAEEPVVEVSCADATLGKQANAMSSSTCAAEDGVDEAATRDVSEGTRHHAKAAAEVVAEATAQPPDADEVSLTPIRGVGSELLGRVTIRGRGSPLAPAWSGGAVAHLQHRRGLTWLAGKRNEDLPAQLGGTARALPAGSGGISGSSFTGNALRWWTSSESGGSGIPGSVA